MSKPRSISKYLGQSLRENREFLGVTQAHVALNASIARSTLVRVENGGHRPTVDLLEQVAHVLHMELSDLIEDAERIRDEIESDAET
jgi:transcriptional regulator with XRE-family HTH domain